MPFHEAGGLRYYTFETFDRHGLPHGIFTRRGGVSPQPWASLNLGGLSGDPRENVIENRRRIFDVFGRPVETIFDAWQVHGRDVLAADRPRPLDSPHQKADGILTDRPEVSLFMRFADCVPVLLFDPVHQAVGLVHAGWRGTLNRAAAAAVERMTAEYGTRPGDVLAGIGPSICVEHYQVGQEVVEAARAAFGARAGEVLGQSNGAAHLDLWAGNRIVLEEAGMQSVEVAELCTAEHTGDWYSHRAERGQTGRFGAILYLK